MTTCNLLKTKKLLASVFLIMSPCVAPAVQAAVPSGKTTVVYFGQLKADEFDAKVKPFFADKARSCKNCEIINHTPYAADGAPDMQALMERIESLPSNTSFVYFDFNLKANDTTKDLIQALNKRADAGLVVVGSAGAPKEHESSGPLSKTMLGQVRGALIIGELAERDRLMPTGFYGPEMLTALRPPRDIMGQGYSPMIFAAALAEKWPKRTSQEWVEHFRSKKMKSRKIWLDMNDMF